MSARVDVEEEEEEEEDDAAAQDAKEMLQALKTDKEENSGTLCGGKRTTAFCSDFSVQGGTVNSTCWSSTPRSSSPNPVRTRGSSSTDSPRHSNRPRPSLMVTHTLLTTSY